MIQLKDNDDYRLRLLNREPNTIATGTDFKAKLMQDLLLHGNAYVEIERDGNEITSFMEFRMLVMLVFQNMEIKINHTLLEILKSNFIIVT